jgi:adenylate cyclase
MGILTRIAKAFSRAFDFTKRHRVGLGISVSVCVISLALYTFLYVLRNHNPILEFLGNIELKTLDMRFKLRGPRLPGPAVVIVAIDQKSQDILGRWPFPRSYLAQAVDYLGESQARVIAFDINFPQPDQNSALRALDQVRTQYDELRKQGFQNRQFDARLKGLEASADNDKQFADSIQRFQNAILGYFAIPQEEASSQNPKLVSDFVNYLSFQCYPQIIPPGAEKRFDGLKAASLSPNLPEFALYAKNFGYFNVIPDPDGTVRREPVVMGYKGSLYPSLDIAASMAYTNLSLDQISVVFNPNGLERIDFGKRSIPTNPEGYVQIDFMGPVGTFPTYSFSDVVLHKLPPQTFKEKLVLIGPTATGIGDMAVTPFQQMAYPGVEVHASFIDDILYDHFIRREIPENLIDIAFLLLFSLVVGPLISAAPPVRTTMILVVVLGIFIWLTYFLFAAYRIWIVAFLPTASLTVNYAGIISYRFFFEEREKRKALAAFTQYLHPGVINQLMQHPELLRLGGEEKELTALFSDIRGFTAMSEGLTPTSLVDILNDYFSEMTDVLMKHWGTLDKYIGDAIMAFWGAPYPQEDHALRACRAALELQQTLFKLQGRWEAQGRPRIDIGVGINTGVMTVGNMGSKKRFNYTIMGDNVNLASRLEGINKNYGTHLIISENTYQAVQKEMLARELDLIRVKGKLKPVKIYELVGTLTEVDQHRDRIERFERGLQAYREGLWATALETLEGLARDYPQDGPSHVFIKRCHDYLLQPPEGVWDGVYVMKTK